MKKTVSLIAFLLICVTAFAGCAAGKAQKPETPAMDSAAVCDSLVKAAASEHEITTVNNTTENAEELFKYVSEYDYTKVKAWFMAYESTGLAEEIVVIQTASARDASDVLETLKTHVQNRISLYRNYAPESVKAMEDALVFTEDSYAVLIASPNQDAVKEAFLKAIK